MNDAAEPAPDYRNGSAVLSGVGFTQRALDRLYLFHKYFIDGVRNGRRLVLRSCDLKGLDFTDMDLRDSELISCDFSTATLVRVDFRFAKLFAARFENADLRGANFEKADLRASVFEGANLSGAKLEGADLRECAIIDHETNEVGQAIASTFRGATLRHTNLANSKLKKVNFNGALLDNTNLANADMREARFQGAEFVNANLLGARLADADLRGAALGETDLSAIDLSTAKTATETDITDEGLAEKLRLHETWVSSGSWAISGH